MRIRFLNPVEQVTGSCYWLRDDERDIEFLVDCGMMQGEFGEHEWNHRPFEFNPAKLRCVFLTHTHIDHCGLLPRLVREGFRGSVYCTRESAELARIALADSARQPSTPYNRADVKKLVFHEPEGQLFGKLHPFGPDLFFGVYRTSHIVGGVAIQIVWGPHVADGEPRLQRSITFSGDLGCNAEGEEHLPLLRHRMLPPPADYAVVESTYGGTVRAPEEQDFGARIGRLKAAIDRGLFERKGVVLIPCFAIDRTQAVLFDLHYLFRSDPERYGNVPVYLNAPLAAKVNDVYAEALRRKEPVKGKGLKSMWLNKRLFDWLDFPRTPKGEADLERWLATILSNPTDDVPQCIYTTQWKPVQSIVSGELSPAIVVTGGGMCDGGMVLGYFESLLPRETTTLLFTGYMSPATIGGKLLQHGRLSPEERRRASNHIEWDEPPPREDVHHQIPLSQVTAQIEQLSGYSGHADQRGLVDWLFSIFKDRPSLAGKTVFITHGANHQRRALEAAIRAKSEEWGGLYPEQHQGVAVELPMKRHGWFDLDAGRWMTEEPDSHAKLLARVEALESRVAAMEEILLRIDAMLGPGAVKVEGNDAP